jgi:hypothetical protein
MSAVSTTLLSFARWPVQGREGAWLAELGLPHLRQWLAQAQRVEGPVWQSANADATLTPAHEQALALLSGWPVTDGQVPHAAQAALQMGLATPDTAQGWGFVRLCHWQVSNGQVTLADPAQLNVSADEDQALLAAMQSFFAEDGLTLHPYQNGCWLVHSPLLVDLPTASLDRVVGQDVNAWLVGCESAQLSPAANTLRRLQNEMQMLLYTHEVNAQRARAINSFWLHGTGRWQADLTQPAHVRVVHALREPALQQNGQAWLDAWREVDTQVLPALLQHVAQGQPQRLVLCGPSSVQVYESHARSWWQRWRARFQTVSVAEAITESIADDL